VSEHAAPARSTVLRCRGVSKYFGAIRALADVDLSVGSGEILAVMGDNGAGKSTLVRIISGVERPDAGQIWFADKEVKGLTPRRARGLGIETVHQHLALCDNLSGSDNVMLGQEPVRFRLGPFSVLDRRRGASESLRLLNEVGASLPDLAAPVRRLSGGQRQALAIARSLAGGGRLIVFDEPTAALGMRQTRATLTLIREIAARGVAVIVVSHSAPDVLGLADRVIAMRLGSVVFDRPIAAVTEDELVLAITGSAVSGGGLQR
jgi:ABC-type sugar transport system ATPase subunit